MSDLAESTDMGMHEASAHASGKEGPAPLTSASALTPTDSVFLADLEDVSVLPSSPAIKLNISASGITSSTTIAAADSHHPTLPISAIAAISSQAGLQHINVLSQQDKEQFAAEEIETDSAQEQRSGSSSQSPPPSSSAGTKRTASGEIKRASVKGLGDEHARPNGVGHLHTSNTIPHVSKENVLELSQQLRTRLKYAMVKVQNGWQTRSLDEVESLASLSPLSTVSGFHFPDQQMLSPKTVMSRKYQRESSDSESSDSTVALENRGLVNMMASPQIPPRRALAPPVDIVPGSRRRPTPNAAYVAVNGSYVQTRALHSARPSTSQRTPSQNAAMEADAVETLLFMASPGNSGYNSTSHASQESSTRSAQVFSAQTSPLRTQFSQTSVASPKKVTFSGAGSMAPTFDKTALIDRMLDDLSDDSDEELERAFRLADKSKIAASVTT